MPAPGNPHLLTHHWRPGQSGNPQGGAAPIFKLAKVIRREVGQGAELVRFYASVMRGELIQLQGRKRPHVPTLDQRIQAANWLSERGWGRAREIIELTGDASSSPADRLAMLRRLTPEEREAIRATLELAAMRPDPAAEGLAPPGSAQSPREDTPHVGEILGEPVPDPRVDSSREPLDQSR